MATDSADFACRELFDVLTGHGLRDVVLSPGSRDTALLLAASARKNLRKHIIADERTAGFAALGIAMVSQRPVALVCTSGTALYNYAPALAEAYYQKIPLIAISADRPEQWIGQDDSQTMIQPGALREIVKKSFDIPPCGAMSTLSACEKFKTDCEWFVHRTFIDAFYTATSGIPGPVHVNMQFAVPFNKTTEYAEGNPRIIINEPNDASLPPHRLKEIANYLIDKRILLVAGFMAADNKTNKAVSAFASLPNVSVIAEPLSNLHLNIANRPAFPMLSRMTDVEKLELRPDIIITIGGALVSAEIKKFLRNCEGAEHWTLSDTPMSADCFMRLSRHIEVSPCRLLSSVSSMLRHILKKGTVLTPPQFGDVWRTAIEHDSTVSVEKYNNSPWSDLKAIYKIYNEIPDSFNLFLSNGTTVRYAGMLMKRLPHACYSNRGVSGIDGTNATAFGCSMAYKGTTLLLTGDISFSYCQEILNLCESDADLRIAVINNGGGGIFRVVKTTRDLDIREEYICCNQRMPLEALARAYNWNYLRADSEATLQTALKELIEKKRTIIEIVTDPEASAKAMINFMNK